MTARTGRPDSPTADEVASFDANGFVVLRGLLAPSEVRSLADAFDAAARSAHQPWARSGVDPNDHESLVTIVSPEGSVPALSSSRLAEEARRVLAGLFGVPEARLLCGWRGFLKPAGGDITPWHQDASYRPPPHHGGTVWVPLDPATEASGCLEFQPGSHREPLRPHVVEGHHFVAQPLPDGPGTVCPLDIGDVSVHNCMTLHRAAANRTARPRRAFAVVCQVVDHS